jgi:aspartate kinase
MIIQKFGGTSVKDVPAMQNVTAIIKKYIDQQPVVVVSALGGITDMLIQALEASAMHEKQKAESVCEVIKSRHHEMVNALISIPEIHQSLTELIEHEIGKLHTLLEAARTIRSKGGVISHAVMSIGEILSSNILSGFLNSQGVKSVQVDARDIIILEERKGDYIPDIETIHKNVQLVIPSLFTENKCVVCPGFIGSTSGGEPATLGRDGSDYTASLIGAALNATQIQIWSDIDGILTADPTIIPYAEPLKTMTFDEACELAYFGARVLHPSTIQPALEKGIPVSVLNSRKPDEKGTLIITNSEKDPVTRPVKSIAYKEDITLITLESSRLLLSPKIIEEIFLILTHYGKKVYAVSKSATKLSITIENHASDFKHIINDIGEYGEVFVEHRKVIVSVVGEQMKGHPSISWQVLQLLDEHNIKFDLVSQFANQISLIFIIGENDIERTVKMLHKNFIEAELI